MNSKDTIKITIRIDKDLKEAADKVLEMLGIDMETAINIFICKIINEQGLPFPVSLKHSGPVTKELPDKFKHTRIISRYDTEEKKAYLEFPDGSREYI